MLRQLADLKQKYATLEADNATLANVEWAKEQLKHLLSQADQENAGLKLAKEELEHKLSRADQENAGLKQAKGALERKCLEQTAQLAMDDTHFDIEIAFT